MIFALLLACASDVSIMRREKLQDTSDAIADSSIVEEPSTEPSGEPSLEPSDEPRSGITGYNHLYLRQVACPACVGESQEITITFTGKYHQPSSDGHTDWIPPSGTCTTSLYGVEPSTVPMAVGSSLSVSNPSHNFTVPALGQGLYETTGIWEAQLQRDAVYQVQTDAGSYSFVSSRGFDFIEPYNMLFVDPSYAFDAAIYRTGATFSWGPTSSDSTFLITVAVYSYDGSQFYGYVSCAGPDSGQMTIPAQYLQQYSPGSLVAIHLARHKVQLVETDINNSYIESHMEWEVVGTGHIE